MSPISLKLKSRNAGATMKPLFVRVDWDDEAEVWVATSDDVPGLATESETHEALIARLKVMIPELLAANGQDTGSDVPFELLTRRLAIAPAFA